MNRKSFLKNLGVVTAGASIAPFQVDETSKKKKSVRFAHLTDIHVKQGEIPEKGMARALQHVQSLSPKVDLIINGGDAIWDALEADKQQTQQQFQLYKTILRNENSLPVHHVIGNHDVWGWFLKNNDPIKQDNLYGKQWAVEEFGIPARHYSFTKGKWKIIVLDSTQLNPAGGYIGKLDEDQFNWLQAELNSVPPSQFICIVSHIPILSICAGLFFDKNEENGDFKIQRNLMHSDFLRIKKLFIQHPNIRTCISGHIHLQDELTYLGIKYYCNGAVSGAWWKGNFQEFAPAYAVMELYDDGTSNRRFYPLVP